MAVIVERGGRVRYDWQPSMMDVASRMKKSIAVTQAGGRSPIFRDEPGGPKWLRRLVGDDYFQHVVEVDLRGNPWTTGQLEISHQEMKQIGSLRQLERLVLVNTTISDTSLEPVTKLTKIRTLIISDSLITDAGLQHLHHLANLEQLQLSNTAVTADGVAKLRQQLPNCVIRLEQPVVH